MESLYIDFSESASLSGRLKFFGITIVVVTLIAITISTINKTFDFYFFLQLFLFLYGIFMLTPYPYRLSTKNKTFFKADNEVIEYRTTPFSLPKKEEWKNISGIIFKPRAIFLETTDNRKKKINLSWVPYKNILIIEQSMKEYATSKGLEIFLFSA